MKKSYKSFRTEEIEPSSSVKTRLDKAFRAHYAPRKEFRLPYYQSFAAAILILVVGVGIGRFFDKPEPTVERIVQQVKYVERPVKEIQYIQVPVRRATENLSKSESSVKDSLRALDASNDLAVADVGSVEEGISMGDDSLLQKMMITIY